ncbi:hypothetical protein V1517DRAFT_324540 [Lipomyces orientalis]|uniref:Uncharacterized protein n=1 Tax=Lipomyces orientalis TaxID=1233043 RepID=A0ACC3TMF0_9ASCO
MESCSMNEYYSGSDLVLTDHDVKSTPTPTTSSLPELPLAGTPTADVTVLNAVSSYYECKMNLANEVCDLDDMDGDMSSSAANFSHSPFVSDDLSTPIQSPLVISIVRAALEIPLSPMTARRKAVIVDAIVPKSIPTSIFHEMAAVYIRRAEILSKGFNMKYLTPVGKQRNRGRPKGHIKRPLNSFMIYRRVQTYLFHASSPETSDDEIGGIIRYESSLLGDLERVNHQSVSVIIGQFWRTESQIVRDAFTKLAKQESSLHRELHPDYKFCPQKKTRKSLRVSSSSPTISRSIRKDSKLAATCQPLRFILPSTERPKLIEQSKMPESCLFETGLSTPTSSPSPELSREDSTLPDTPDDVWPTFSPHGWSYSSSAPAPDFRCLEQIPLSSSEVSSCQNCPVVRIADYHCDEQTQERFPGTHDLQTETSFAGPFDYRSCLPLTGALEHSGYSIVEVAGSNDLEVGEASAGLLERVVKNSPSFAHHLIGSVNGLKDMAIETGGYDDIDQSFRNGFNMWTGNNCSIELCN